MSNEPRFHPVNKLTTKLLRIWGVVRRLFFLALISFVSQSEVAMKFTAGINSGSLKSGGSDETAEVW